MNRETPKKSGSHTYSEKLGKAGRKHAGQAWHRRHMEALNRPHTGFETALVSMLRGWLHYADTHAAQHNSAIGADRVLGDHWAAIGQGLRGLLDGEAGRLDCGCLDAVLGETLEAEGYGQ